MLSRGGKTRWGRRSIMNVISGPSVCAVKDTCLDERSLKVAAWEWPFPFHDVGQLGLGRCCTVTET
jgi:hypothetical protein